MSRSEFQTVARFSGNSLDLTYNFRQNHRHIVVLFDADLTALADSCLDVQVQSKVC